MSSGNNNGGGSSSMTLIILLGGLAMICVSCVAGLLIAYNNGVFSSLFPTTPPPVTDPLVDTVVDPPPSSKSKSKSKKSKKSKKSSSSSKSENPPTKQAVYFSISNASRDNRCVVEDGSRWTWILVGSDTMYNKSGVSMYSPSGVSSNVQNAGTIVDQNLRWVVEKAESAGYYRIRLDKPIFDDKNKPMTGYLTGCIANSKQFECSGQASNSNTSGVQVTRKVPNTGTQQWKFTGNAANGWIISNKYSEDTKNKYKYLNTPCRQGRSSLWLFTTEPNIVRWRLTKSIPSGVN